MNSIADLAALAVEAARAHPNCPADQALVYGCEDVLESQCPSRMVAHAGIPDLVKGICESEGIDVPIVGRLGRHVGGRRRTIATADVEAHEVRFESDGATISTVLHELAHLTSGMDDHGVLFRDEFVRLLRRHCDVGRAAMLHGLFAACGLEMSPWPASAS